MTEPDPCCCDASCPHGVRCGAGHANFPDSHWWPTCEQGCSKPTATISRRGDGWWEAAMTACGHKLVGTSIGSLTRMGVDHRRQCQETL